LHLDIKVLGRFVYDKTVIQSLGQPSFSYCLMEPVENMVRSTHMSYRLLTPAIVSALLLNVVGCAIMGNASARSKSGATHLASIALHQYFS